MPPLRKGELLHFFFAHCGLDGQGGKRACNVFWVPVMFYILYFPPSAGIA